MKGFTAEDAEAAEILLLALRAQAGFAFKSNAAPPQDVGGRGGPKGSISALSAPSAVSIPG